MSGRVAQCMIQYLPPMMGDGLHPRPLGGGTEWLANTPEGYFAASAHGADVIQWRQGDKLWPLATFRRRFERPDLVRRALAR
jgi:hypothetical protein